MDGQEEEKPITVTQDGDYVIFKVKVKSWKPEHSRSAEAAGRESRYCGLELAPYFINAFKSIVNDIYPEAAPGVVFGSMNGVHRRQIQGEMNEGTFVPSEKSLKRSPKMRKYLREAFIAEAGTLEKHPYLRQYLSGESLKSSRVTSIPTSGPEEPRQ